MLQERSIAGLESVVLRDHNHRRKPSLRMASAGSGTGQEIAREVHRNHLADQGIGQAAEWASDRLIEVRLEAFQCIAGSK